MDLSRTIHPDDQNSRKAAFQQEYTPVLIRSHLLCRSRHAIRKFKAGAAIHVVKKQFSVRPESIARPRAKAFMDRSLHGTRHRRSKRAAVSSRHFHLQPVFPLADHSAIPRPLLHSGSAVGCQSILPVPMNDRTDTSGKSNPRQRDRHDGQHQAGRLILLPRTLRPKIALRKRMPPVCFDIARSAREIEALSVDVENPFQPVSHADDAMGALHRRNEAERPMMSDRRRFNGPNARFPRSVHPYCSTFIFSPRSSKRFGPIRTKNRFSDA